MASITPELSDLLAKHHYAVVGRHSAVKACHWTKESIRNGRPCYKERFYGISSHRCLQMTPAVGWCTQRCLHCWRPVESTLGDSLDGEVDEPEAIVEGAIAAQRRLLVGYKGLEGVDPKRLEEAFEPRNAAVSLAGEPTLYPRLDDLIYELHRRGITTFVVTNGTRPDRLPRFTEPTQLYVSLDAPDRATYLAAARPTDPGSWERVLASLDRLRSYKCRTVVRLTLAKGVNMLDPAGYGALVKRAQPTFVEVKAYMHVGFSRQRLPREAMPSHEEVRAFARDVAKASGYEVADQQQDSRVVLLK